MSVARAPRPDVFWSVLSAGLIGLLALTSLSCTGDRASGPAAHSGTTDPTIAHYTCAMHPSVERATAGVCPICGMQLTAVTTQQLAEGVVVIDAAQRQRIGLQLSPARSLPLRLQVRGPGRVVDEHAAAVEAELNYQDIIQLQLGQAAQITTPTGKYIGKLTVVYPYMDSPARTGQIRLDVRDPAQQLRLGMYASVEFSIDAGLRLQVPTSAVLYVGPRRIVFVSLADDRLKPQPIQLGRATGDMLEVTAGLEPGQLVATSATFLLAAEARIHSDATYWNPEAVSGRPRASAQP